MYYATTIASCFALCVFIFRVFASSIHFKSSLSLSLSSLSSIASALNNIQRDMTAYLYRTVRKARSHRAGSEVVTLKICRNFANVESFSWKYVLGFCCCHRCIRLRFYIVLFGTRHLALRRPFWGNCVSHYVPRKNPFVRPSRVQEHMRIPQSVSLSIIISIAVVCIFRAPPKSAQNSYEFCVTEKSEIITSYRLIYVKVVSLCSCLITMLSTYSCDYCAEWRFRVCAWCWRR